MAGRAEMRERMNARVRIDPATTAVLAIDKESAVLNCGICEYDFEPDDERLCVPSLRRYNFAAPLKDEHMPITAEPDEIVGAR